MSGNSFSDLLPDACKEHSELFHYTNGDGLRGILNSKTLWATNFRDLNDFSEIVHAKKFIEEAIFSSIKEYVVTRFKAAKFLEKNKFRKMGGSINVAKKEAKIFAHTLYEAALTGGPSANPFFDPYIISFCSPSKQYEIQNGLLSMWRSYGEDGYAIVFDSKIFWELAGVEQENFKYEYIDILKTVYGNNLSTFQKHFRPLIEKSKALYLLAVETDEVGPDMLLSFVKTVSRFKHVGFREEKEIRMILSPAHPDRVKAELNSEQKVGNKVKMPQSDKNGKRYIVINEVEPRSKLPIKRIIVGPGRNQPEGYAATAPA